MKTESIQKSIVFWGTYDKGKPRTRLLIKGAESAGYNVIECHADIWRDIEDKSQIIGFQTKLIRSLRLLFSYPRLIFRYMKLPPHDMVVVGYMGQLDILIIWAFAKLRKIPVCWDIFISLYDTVVVDRKILTKSSLAAVILYHIEWVGIRMADLKLFDTREHAAYIEKLYGVPLKSIAHVYVGAEKPFFLRKITISKDKTLPFTVLFYGQFIPLHGIEYIVKAAKLSETRGSKIRWILIGKGQEAQKIDEMISSLGIRSITRIQWVKYEELIDYVLSADVCLGVFNPVGKATRVIPNKVFQILAAGKPLITGDTPAVREILSDDCNDNIMLVSAGSATMILKSVLHMKMQLTNSSTTNKNISHSSNFSYDYHEVGKTFSNIIEQYLSSEKI